jgi:predicted N-acetyltransferase YhbS
MDVTVVPAIEPLPAQVEETTYDDEGNVTGTIMVDNPEIVRDDAERAAAQGVIAVTPDEVKSFPAS